MSTDGKLVEVYLVPGFLGFESLGGLEYFIDVKQFVKNKLGATGARVEVYPTETEPAGSFHRRAVKLATEVADKHSPDATSVHFVGHSTGGLDIRVLLSPGGAIDRDASLGGALDAEGARNLRDALDKARSATSVATPHFGSPIASLALRLDVDLLLRGISQVLKFGPTGFFLNQGLLLAGLATAIVRGLPGDKPFIDWLGGEVLSHPPNELIKYLQHVAKDAGALRNLTQEGTNLANALLIDRANVGYGSIITGTQEPSGLIETTYPIIYFNTILFRQAWDIVARRNPDYPYSKRGAEIQTIHSADQSTGLVGELDIDDRVNDGVVPTESQAYGTILGVFASDHLDCVGHYPHDRPNGKHVPGWVRSGAGFNKDRFDLLWTRACDFMAAAETRLGNSAPDANPDHMNP